MADVFARKSGREPVPGWLDVYHEKDPAQKKQMYRICAHAIWEYLSGLAVSGDIGFAPATLQVTPDGKPELGTPGDGGIPGWKWEGLMANATNFLWPSLWGKNDNTNPENTPAITFRTELSRYNRVTQNAVLIRRGGLTERAPTGGTALSYPSTWFVSAEWNNTPPARAIATQVSETRLKAEAKITPAEAGEDRAPAPVIGRFACRRPACKPNPQTFASSSARNRHEEQHDKVITSGDAYKCRGCGILYTSPLARKNHEKSAHPAVFRKMYTVPCPYPGTPCDEMFEASNIAKRLGHHLGAMGHQITDKATRGILIHFAQTGYLPDDFTWNGEAPSIRRSTTTTPEPEAAPAVVTRPPAAVQAVVAPTPTAGTTTATTDVPGEDGMEKAAIAYLTRLMKREAEATQLYEEAAREITALREENKRLQADAELGRQVRGLMPGQAG